jgi:hypothetical protein
MNEKSIVSTATLLASLASWWYAKQMAKDAVPCMMIGGFIGAIIGETIAEVVESAKGGNEKKKKKDE